MNNDVACAEMPKYGCHKTVWALKIKSIEQESAKEVSIFDGGDWLLVPEDTRYGPIRVGHYDYMLRHKPVVGGYYVVYADGYKSFSPAEAFEAGYTLIK